MTQQAPRVIPRVWDHRRRVRIRRLAQLHRWWEAHAARWLRVWAILRLSWSWSDAQSRSLSDMLAWWVMIDPDRRLVLRDAAMLMHGPGWDAARDAVANTSLTLRLNRKTAWVKLASRLKDRQGWPDGTWRRLHALEQLVDSGAANGLSRSNQTALIELAYLDHRRTGFRPRGVSRGDV